MTDILQGTLKAEDFDKHKKGNWQVHAYDSCTSTFDLARQKIADNAERGTLIIADVQKGGRGRQSRKWFSPSGGIWMCTIIKKPLIDLNRLSAVTLLCAVAVSKAMEEMFPDIKPAIKWPNDIYIGSRKVCGILTETVMQGKNAEYIIIGIGINANNSTGFEDNDIKGSSISLIELGYTVDRPRMASLINDNVLEAVVEYEKHGSIGFIMDYYSSHMLWLGSEAVMKNTITGEAANQGIVKGIDEEGRLLLESNGETEHILSGELSLRSI
ncbi:MAG: biotin--[acetyl-CoA-carboxylase] ligase [Clostridia bacterium]|nr:biotin--[acetyl-CoA-carboxylase] ligase [Clostridia bacterium]